MERFDRQLARRAGGQRVNIATRSRQVLRLLCGLRGLASRFGRSMAIGVASGVDVRITGAINNLAAAHALRVRLNNACRTHGLKIS